MNIGDHVIVKFILDGGPSFKWYEGCVKAVKACGMFLVYFNDHETMPVRLAKKNKNKTWFMKNECPEEIQYVAMGVMDIDDDMLLLKDIKSTIQLLHQNVDRIANEQNKLARMFEATCSNKIVKQESSS